jgi:DNA-binding NarL/FixJ family response regulator
MTIAQPPAHPLAGPRRKSLLLVESDSLFRRTVALVARDLNLADVREASSHEAALRLLEQAPYDGLLLDIGEGVSGFGIAQSVRHGDTQSHPGVPIVVMAASCDAGTVSFFKSLPVQRIMLKPFKVKTVVEVIAALAASSWVPAM